MGGITRWAVFPRLPLLIYNRHCLLSVYLVKVILCFSDSKSHALYLLPRTPYEVTSLLQSRSLCRQSMWVKCKPAMLWRGYPPKSITLVFYHYYNINAYYHVTWVSESNNRYIILTDSKILPKPQNFSFYLFICHTSENFRQLMVTVEKWARKSARCSNSCCVFAVAFIEHSKSHHNGCASQPWPGMRPWRGYPYLFRHIKFTTFFKVVKIMVWSRQSFYRARIL